MDRNTVAIASGVPEPSIRVRTGLTYVCPVSAWFLAATVVNAATAKLPADLARAAAGYDRAQIDGDGAALERLLAKDYRRVNSRGEVEPRRSSLPVERSDFQIGPICCHPG